MNSVYAGIERFLDLVRKCWRGGEEQPGLNGTLIQNFQPEVRRKDSFWKSPLPVKKKNSVALVR
jgi:hypothetical protein